MRTDELNQPVQQHRRAWQRCAGALRDADPAGRLAATHGFVLRRTELVEHLGDAGLRRHLRHGNWRPVRRGLFAVRLDAPNAIRVQQATAAARARSGHVISGASAASLLGLPTLRDVGPPELTARSGDRGRRRPTVSVKGAGLNDEQIESWFGVPVTTLARTITDVARADRASGLVAADAALRAGLIDRATLGEAAAECVSWPGGRAAAQVAAWASGRSESPLESLLRLTIRLADLPDPVEQAWLYGPGWRYRVDLLWPDQRVVAEADGRIKYAQDALWREKRRQEDIERAGYRVVRVLWGDLRGTAARAETVRRISWALTNPSR